MKSRLYCSHRRALYILNNQARLDNSVLWKLILLKVWMKESLYFSSCDAASNLGYYWYISELKKCVQLKLEMNIIGVVNLHEVSVTTSKKINKTKSLNKFKKRIRFCLVNSSILDLKLIRSIRSVKQYFQHNPHWKLQPSFPLQKVSILP